MIKTIKEHIHSAKKGSAQTKAIDDKIKKKY
jgi:hypothetical protein